MKFSMKGQERKNWPFNTDDCFIEVTACSGLTSVSIGFKIAKFMHLGCKQFKIEMILLVIWN
jgi:hypothetical protein